MVSRSARVGLDDASGIKAPLLVSHVAQDRAGQAVNFESSRSSLPAKPHVEPGRLGCLPVRRRAADGDLSERLEQRPRFVWHDR